MENLIGISIHFGFKDLQTTTNNFSVKLGQSEFISVCKEVLLDRTQLASKSAFQGKEF